MNAACSGLAEARPIDGPSNEGGQHTCSLKNDRYQCNVTRCCSMEWICIFIISAMGSSGHCSTK
ncbi:hypothetical protein CS536_18620 [Yersinia kristensenii]|nr:hypothetical protein CS536_18620 [Yersinia kristensenii]PJE82870.1 hypothetical protein CU276_16195 [Yersinia kristensenii]